MHAGGGATPLKTKMIHGGKWAARKAIKTRRRNRKKDLRERKRQHRVDAGVAQHGGRGAAERAGAGSLAEAAVVGALSASLPPAPALPPDRVEADRVRQDRAELHDEDPEVVQPEPVALVLLRDPALGDVLAHCLR